MKIHKPEEERLPHEGLEYYRKSKEPETYQECIDLFCWYCVHDSGFGFFQKCKHYQILRQKEVAKSES